MVTIDGEVVSSIGPGLMVLLGVEEVDCVDDAAWLAGKIVRMRIFADADDKMNLSLADTHGEALIISQFTLHASTKKGNRPSFLQAAAPTIAEPLYEEFCRTMEREMRKNVGRGRFGANMQVELVNDGPVTIVIDSQARE